MEKEQFRYGNYCQDQNNNLLKVSEINDNGVVFTVADRSKFPLPDGWQAQPILLTEEWLQKFGFSDKDYKNGYIGIDFKGGNMIMDFVLAKPYKIGEHQEFYAYEMQNFRYKEIGFVHQLQNLFFTLTGTELILKSEINNLKS